ncbi:hypothetical protein LOZ58_005111 [Ophidiomyces ophidiicola]|nr:hypothetical protein LOZ58_005111 [Ophidiomyces ophidiicola]
MPYLANSQDFLKQSSLLLEAYPHTTRITTKYSYPKPPKSKTPTKDASSVATSIPSSTAPAPATLTLKTFNPHNGICLKYRTTKAAEVGRLIAGLGRLASGAPIADAALAPAQVPADSITNTHADVEMLDVSATPGSGAGGNSNESQVTGKGNAGGGGGGGGKKKKGGKGKR